MFGRDREETIANVARFSKKDAETFRDWNRRAEEITARILIPERYAEPLPQAERDALLAKTAIGRDFLTISRRQPLDVVQELFENDHVKLLFLFKVSLFGTWLTDTLSKTSPMGSVIRAFDLETGYQLCQGGSFNLARGLMETFIAAGGTFQPQVAIDRILIEGGRARGIVLADGKTVRARQFVASTINVHQTFEQMIGRSQLPAAFAEKLDRFQYTNWTLFGLHLALHEAPQFSAAAVRSEYQPDAEMEHRRRDHGGSQFGVRGRQSQPAAAHRPVRLRTVERGRSDPGAARQAHHVLLACDAVRSRSGRTGL